MLIYLFLISQGFKILTVMNIEKLLRKLDKNSLESKKQFLTAHGPYKLKTSQSIGTLNSIENQNQRSFVINDAQTPYNRKIGTESLSANSKLDQQLSNIQKMKNLYESRQFKNRLSNKSMEKSSASGKKSFENHLLKPSNTPSFNKIQKDKLIQQQQNDSACKNLYSEKVLQSSQVSHNSGRSTNKNYMKIEKKNLYQYPDSSLHIEEHEAQPYEQQPSYNQQSISQIGNVSQDLPYEVNIKQHQTKSQITTKQKRNNYEIKSNNIVSTRLSQQCNCNCTSKSEIQNRFYSFQQKINRLTQRVDQLQKQSKQANQNQIKIQNENAKLKIVLVASNQQRQKIILESKKVQQEKQELEVLLKDVLYKREREKLQSSKENTFRQNQKIEKKVNNFSFAQSQSYSELKPPRNISNSQLRQSQSKMKVQNLLHKLQIKVDRT